jgi:glyoxylase-like metal-dependent hydrolase (beta-lactamase superfamily II)
LREAFFYSVKIYAVYLRYCTKISLSFRKTKNKTMEQVSDNIYQISLGAVNTFLIEDEGLTLVDTGYKGSTEKIFEAIKKGGKNPDDIRQIILTHSHPDHAGSAAEIKRRLNIPVYAHAEDASLMAQGIAGRLPHVLSPGLANWIVFRMFIKNSKNEIDPLKVDHLVADNDIIPIAGGIQAIYTPGHSKGHIALLVKKEGLLIAGDICANMMGLGLSTVYEDRAVGVQSILKAASHDFNKAIFGHGKPLMKDANKKMKEKFGK